MSRKVHPAAVIKNLPDEDQAALFEFLSSKTVVDGVLRGRTLADGVTWLFSNNGVRTNDSSLSDWRGWYEMNRRIDSWDLESDKLAEKLSRRGVPADLVPKLAQSVFMLRAAETDDAEIFAKMASIVQRHVELESQQKAHSDKMQLEDKKLKRKDRSLDQAEKKLAQAERKIAALEASATAASSKLKELRDPAKAEDPAMRQRILDEVDRAMGIKH